MITKKLYKPFTVIAWRPLPDPYQKQTATSSTDRIPIYIEATQQETTARLKIESIGDTGLVTAILYDIQELKPFSMFTKVKIFGQELEFYLDRDKSLVCRDHNLYDFWFKK